MLTITESAGDHLAQLLTNAPDEAVVRFVPGTTGLTMQVDQVQPGDTTFEHGDKTILALQPAVNDALAEKSLDLQPSQDGPQLTLV
mgnify:CR=1 FL=1